MTSILDLLLDVTGAKAEFSFVPAEIRHRVDTSLKQGLDCLLATQVSVGGKRTAWAQQYDALTLRPSSARNYEMPSLSSGESAGVMLFLMRLPDPDANVVAAVHGAAAWLERVAIQDQSYQRGGADGPQLVATSGSGPTWSRYYELGTNRPIFGDRDKSIHDTVAEISRERRIGYAWFTDGPQAALKNYAKWKQSH
jgi:PelA/Pel-15E family pectate lyase